MSKDVDPWQEGQQAWGRLAGWSRDTPAATGPQDDGDRALTALTDIGVIRRFLDQVEFEAVRTARRQRKSWSEIAIRLGVTRQSAWERWRDVDEAASSTGPASVLATEADAVARARLVLGGSPTGPDDVSMRAREMRRRSFVLVPNVVGMSWDDAHAALQRSGLVAVGPDPDGPPMTATGWPQSVVTDQSPESGATVPPGAHVTLWVDRGGGSGVREPRRPKPDPKTGRKMWDEVTDEAVS
ncbi:MAG TPA: PASTA domain-containing protein [Pseudonocardiaceae bacterium]